MCCTPARDRKPYGPVVRSGQNRTVIPASYDAVSSVPWAGEGHGALLAQLPGGGGGGGAEARRPAAAANEVDAVARAKHSPGVAAEVADLTDVVDVTDGSRMERRERGEGDLGEGDLEPLDSDGRHVVGEALGEVQRLPDELCPEAAEAEVREVRIVVEAREARMAAEARSRR